MMGIRTDVHGHSTDLRWERPRNTRLGGRAADQRGPPSWFRLTGDGQQPPQRKTKCHPQLRPFFHREQESREGKANTVIIYWGCQNIDKRKMFD